MCDEVRNSIYNDLKSKGVRINKDDLYKWIDYACGIFLFVRIHRHSSSLRKEFSASDKYYTIDNGLRNSVLLPQSDELGKNLETVVMLELKRRLRPFEKLTYYQGDHECDFVVQGDEAVSQLVQVTWSIVDEDTRQREIRGLLEAAKATKCDDLAVVTTDENAEITVPGRTAMD